MWSQKARSRLWPSPGGKTLKPKSSQLSPGDRALRQSSLTSLVRERSLVQWFSVICRCLVPHWLFPFLLPLNCQMIGLVALLYLMPFLYNPGSLRPSWHFLVPGHFHEKRIKISMELHTKTPVPFFCITRSGTHNRAVITQVKVNLPVHLGVSFKDASLGRLQYPTTLAHLDK